MKVKILSQNLQKLQIILSKSFLLFQWRAEVGIEGATAPGIHIGRASKE